ncbi:hypothetical protein KAR91_14965 [Candidatus Pacearchaeota archaeon]|nr:hypothetical protein [Candidatus Pacearchaeota archaeon]
MRRALIDFDGVIHEDSEWNLEKYRAGKIDGVPTEGARDTLEMLERSGFEIWIFTARLPAGRNKAGDIEAWLRTNSIPFHGVTGQKLEADVYIDDRAIRYTDWRTTCSQLLNLFGERLQRKTSSQS